MEARTYLNPQQYALALAYRKKLETTLLLGDIKGLHELITPHTSEVTVTIEETTTLETTTPLAPHITSLTLPPEPDQGTYSPLPLDRQDRPNHLFNQLTYDPTPTPRKLPPVDPWNAESVKRWAMARWPESESTANKRKGILVKEAFERANLYPDHDETPHQRRLRADRERKRAKRNASKQPMARATGNAVSASNGLGEAGASNDC